MGLNEDLFRAINGAGSPLLDPVMVAFGVVGSLLAYLWAVPLWVDRRRREAVDLILLLVLVEVLVFVLKVLVAAPRPFEVLPVRFVPVPFDDVSDPAFPSGHTARAFAAAVLLTLRMTDPRRSLPWFVYAGMVGLSRIYVGVHWPSDVVGGAVVGIGVAVAFERMTRMRGYADARDRLVDPLAAIRGPTA